MTAGLTDLPRICRKDRPCNFLCTRICRYSLSIARNAILCDGIHKRDIDDPTPNPNDFSRTFRNARRRCGQCNASTRRLCDRNSRWRPSRCSRDSHMAGSLPPLPDRRNIRRRNLKKKHECRFWEKCLHFTLVSLVANLTCRTNVFVLIGGRRSIQHQLAETAMRGSRVFSSRTRALPTVSEWSA